MRWGATGGLFKKARVALEEEDMKKEVKGKRAEVEESGYEAPVLYVYKSYSRSNQQWEALVPDSL